MPDVDDLFEQFRRGGFLGTPPGADAVRQVHRHRRRVHTAAGGALAAALIAVPAVGFATADRDGTRPNPSDTGTPTAPYTQEPPTTTPPANTDEPEPTQEPDANEPTEIPAAAMLQESDLPARFTAREVSGNDWTLYSVWNTVCGVTGPPVGPQLDSRRAGFTGDRDEIVNERVVRYEDVDAARAWLAGARDTVRACAQQEIVDQDFAGDESLVIRTDDHLHVLVRQGALVAEVWPKHLTDESVARERGERAAERLCAGTLAC